MIVTKYNYSAAGWIRLMRDLILTKVFFREARLIRRPFYLRGKRSIHFGARLTTGVGCRVEAYAETRCITLGDDVQINDHVHIAAVKNVSIGNRVLIASRVFIADHNHGSYEGTPLDSPPGQPPAARPIQANAVSIEDDVWLGEHVCVLPGVTIGRGSVIGAGSVVTKSIPPESIAVGSPARVVKRFDATKMHWVRC